MSCNLTNAVLAAFEMRWNPEDERMICHQCNVVVSAAGDGTAASHRAGCRNRHSIHPWRELRAILTPADGGLWCFHLPGPDDVYAAPSFVDAQVLVTAWNAYVERESVIKLTPGPKVAAVVASWPHSAESHALDVTQWGDVVRGFSIGADTAFSPLQTHCITDSRHHA